jgi:hypothetical protein
MPAAASTTAMPVPIKPAPTTPTPDRGSPCSFMRILLSCSKSVWIPHPTHNLAWFA